MRPPLSSWRPNRCGPSTPCTSVDPRFSSRSPRLLCHVAYRRTPTRGEQSGAEGLLCVADLLEDLRKPWPHRVKVQLKAVSPHYETFLVLAAVAGEGLKVRALWDADPHLLATVAAPVSWWWSLLYEVKTAGSDWVLSPTQGFFVKATSAGTVTFDKNNQAITGNTFQRASKTILKLWITDGEKNRYTKIDYIPNGTKGFDYGFEGETFGGASNSLSVFTHLLEENQGKNYQVQTLPNTDYETMIIPVGVIAAADKELTFTAEAMNFPTDLKVYLEDRDTNTFTRLDEANTKYKITVTNTLDGIGRFYLHTSQKALSVTPNFVAEHVSIYKANSSTLRIAGLSQGKASVKLFNILGREVLNTSFTSNGLKDIALPRLAKGVYVVQLTTGAFKVNKKIILE